MWLLSRDRAGVGGRNVSARIKCEPVLLTRADRSNKCISPLGLGCFIVN